MKLRSLLLASLWLASTAVLAQVPAEIAAKNKAAGKVLDRATSQRLYEPLQQREPYAVPGLRVARDIPYGPSEMQKLDVFTIGPAAGVPAKPVFIYVHGGAYVGGDKSPVEGGVRSPFYDNVMLWAAKHGLVGININFDLAPKATYPSVQNAIATAIVWAQRNAAQYGGDPKRIYLMGHSSGATHVANYVSNPAFHPPGGSGLRGAVISSGGFDSKADQGKPYYEPSGNFGKLDFVPGALASGIPLLVFQAEYDPDWVPDGQRAMKQAAVNARVKPRFVLNKDHAHLTQTYSFNTGDESVSKEVEAFIRAHP